jgi:hypothetical protein
MIIKPFKISCVVSSAIMCASVAGWVSAAPTNNAAVPAAGVAKATRCTAGDHPEVALQGQVPAAMRANGFNGFNCNLKLEGQYTGIGGGVAYASFKDDHGHYCAYYSHGTSPNGGTNVLDLSDPKKPVLTAQLTTPAVGTPGETLRVNARRQLLAAVRTGGVAQPGGPEVDVYDLSADCRTPKLLASVSLGPIKGGDSSPWKALRGHDANFSMDGLTFYNGDPNGKMYSAIDLSDPTKPTLIAQMDMSTAPLNGKFANGTSHGLSLSEDGNRGYFVSIGLPTPAEVKDPNSKASDGIYVVDTSEVQARKANPQMKVISSLAFKNGSAAQHTLAIKIGGKPYVIFVDESGAAGLPGVTGGTLQDACNAGLTPFPMGRIIDISDETKPMLVANLALETHDLANCQKVLPDTVGEGTFTYGSHICSVDNRENATALACAYWQSGIRVFDIRNPAAPKEIAYFNPAPMVDVKFPLGGDQPTKVNSCGAPMGFDFERKLLTTMCMRSGALVLKFENGVWPMRESTPAPRGISYN